MKDSVNDMTKRILSIALVLPIFAFSVSLSSCRKYSGENFGDLYEAISIYEEMVLKQEELEALEARKTYVVIIPQNCGAELFNSAAFLSGIMSKYVGYKVEVYYDCDIKSKSSNFEILIGETNREKSQRYAKTLRAYDYGYEYVEGAVTICGHSDSLVMQAVESFANGIVSGEISTAYINATKEFLVRSDYDIRSTTLCGFPISEYVIVYPKNNKLSEKVIATKLKAALEECVGYSLPVISDTEASASAKYICIGEGLLTKSVAIDGAAVIASTENKGVELLAKDNYGLNFCAEQFLKLVKDSETDGVCNIAVNGITKSEYQNEPISFYLVRGDYLASDVEAYRTVVNGVLDNSVAVFDRLSSTVLTNLRRNLGYIASIDSNSFYYFDDSKFRCIESKSFLVGTAEIVTLLMENSKGERFAFIGGFNNNEQEKISDLELLEKLSAECEKFGDLPLLVAHELGEELDALFAKDNPRLESIVAGGGIYISADTFSLVSESKSEIIYPLFADTVGVELCFK